MQYFSALLFVSVVFVINIWTWLGASMVFMAQGLQKAGEGPDPDIEEHGQEDLTELVHLVIDKPKVIIQNQSQKLTTWFSLKSQWPTTPPPRESFKKHDRAILSK